MIDIIYFQEKGKAPVLDWIMSLTEKAQIKCLARIKLLKEKGHKLHRPYADLLQDDIYELRIVYSGNQYRILYSFYGKDLTILTHSFLKKSKSVPKKKLRLPSKEWRNLKGIL